MEDNDMISVIVTTYNQQDTIGRTLDSVLMQRCHLPFEIVVGEDGSSDNTRKVCEEYAERYPGVVRLMPKVPNKGVVDNYFDCLLACRGMYIADCAGDDYWTDPEKLEKEVSVMEADTSVTIVHTNWRSRDETTGQVAVNTEVPFPDSKTDGKRMLEAIVTQMKAPVVHLCTAMYRAETIIRCYYANKDLFRGKGLVCEDMQLVFMLALNGKVAYIPDVTITYCIGKPSVSSPADNAKRFEFYSKAAELSWTLASRYAIDTPRTRAFFSQRVFELFMYAFRGHDRKLRGKSYEYMALWNVRPDKKIRLVTALTSNAVLWNMCLGARLVFIRLKRLLRC